MSEERRKPLPTLTIVLAGLAVVVVAALSVSFWPDRSAGAKVVNGELTHTVSRSDLLIDFTERGTIKASKSVPVHCELEGQNTIVSVIAEGTFVKEGDVLCVLDSSSLEERLNLQRITVQTSRASWEQADEQLSIQKSLNTSNLETARLEIELAEIDLKRYTQGDYPQAKKKAENDILLAQENLIRAKDKYEWTVKLSKKGYVTRLDEQSDRLAVKSTEVTYEQAVRSLEVLEEWTHLKEDKTFKSALEQSKSAEGRAKSKANAELAKATSDVVSKKSTYDLSEKRLAKLEDQLSKTEIRAPQDGMVVYEASRYRRGGEVMIEQGANVQENQTLMQLPDVSVMAAEIQVHETWIDQVRVGVPTLISIDAQDLNLRGKVTKIGLLPDKVNRWLNPDLKAYKTEITIDAGEDTSVLRPGMSAKVRVIVAKLEDVISVPVQSVSTVDKQTVCYVLDGDEFVPKEVETGLSNERHVHIVEGLEVGDVLQKTAPDPKGDVGDEQSEAVERIEIVESELGPSRASMRKSAEGGAAANHDSSKRGSGYSAADIEKFKKMSPEDRKKLVERMKGRGGGQGSSDPKAKERGAGKKKPGGARGKVKPSSFRIDS